MQYAPEERNRLIAALRHHPPYIALIDYLEELNRGVEEELAIASNAADVLRVTRLWQISKKFIHILKTAPEAMDSAILEEQGRNTLELMEHPWALQDFANMNSEG